GSPAEGRVPVFTEIMAFHREATITS
ncbi:hypothetical protein SAMN05216276_11791, partial [Streptosporangium subroseum]